MSPENQGVFGLLKEIVLLREVASFMLKLMIKWFILRTESIFTVGEPSQVKTYD